MLTRGRVRWMGNAALLGLTFGCAAPGPLPAALEAAPPNAESAAATKSNEKILPVAEIVPEPHNPGLSVFFDPGSSAIDAEGLALLKRSAERLRADRRLRVVLHGMTDDQGSRAYNVAIADRRISSVQNVLREYGVLPRQIKRRNAGGENPLRACSTNSCRKTMRRVELRFYQ